MSPPLCPCGRATAVPGDPCILCQLEALRKLATSCHTLAHREADRRVARTLGTPSSS